MQKTPALVLGSLLVLALPPACGAAADESESSAALSFDEPIYALMTQVYDTEDRTVYFWLTHTLDPKAVSLRDAREYPGVTNLNAIDGRVLVSSGQEPSITEFEISDAFDWIEGDTVNFQDYPLNDNANWYYQFVLDEHTAYLPFEGYKRLVWDPTEMSITKVMADSSLEFERKGLMLEAGGNRAGVAYDGAVLQAFFYRDEDWFEFGEESLIVSYDPETHRERDLIRAPCPGLAIATLDEQGHTYFGTFDYLPGLALYGEGPPPCAVRIDADGELDEAWTRDFTELTDGRYVVNFRYVGNGKALGNVLHHEELDIDRGGPLDVELVANLWQTGPHWKLWMFDLDEERAWPVEGVDVEMGPGAQFAVLDGRTFAFVPFNQWRRSKVYELDEGGVAREHFEIQGDVFKWVRVR